MQALTLQSRLQQGHHRAITYAPLGYAGPAHCVRSSSPGRPITKTPVITPNSTMATPRSVRIKEVARSGAIFERTGESEGIQGGTQWLAAPGLMLCAYGRVEGLSRGGEGTHSCVKKCKTIARASIPVTRNVYTLHKTLHIVFVTRCRVQWHVQQCGCRCASWSRVHVMVGRGAASGDAST